MSRKLVLLLLCCLLFAGCTNARLLLRKNQKVLSLKPEQGGVVFSMITKGPLSFKPNSVNIQELNQYKVYSQKPFLITPLTGIGPGSYSNIYLFSLKLPKGTYRISTFVGWLGGFFGSNHFLTCNKVFDVAQGKITYAGRVDANVIAVDYSIITVADYSNQDLPIFLENYPILKDIKINNDVMY